MKIRNLRLYFERYFNDKVTDSIGVSNDVIYKNIVNNKQLDSLVGDLVSFALNPAVQVFYELIQNGHDANADRVAFFIAEDYFIVINNGSSIRSDFPDQNNLLPKGQIISFLSKGLGEKYGDPDSIGKHGQGSKLLNFFLTPFSDGNGENIERNTDEKLKDEIINKLNGPIIFSWDILKQLEGLLSSDFTDLQCSEDFLPSDPLFFKVVLSYYPAFPGEVRSVKGKQGREIFTRADRKSVV